ncbi:MAG: tetratricopeptide repeat protein [Acidobacteria bacterium]|nr:tetratricopeptide repeat protein [Acidobacteriota bacterium]
MKLRLRIVVLAAALPLISICTAQTPSRVSPPKSKLQVQDPSKGKPQAKPKPQDNFQQHFTAARTFQLSGDQDHAAAEYAAFLAGALRSSAKASYELGEIGRASNLFEQALRVSPDDPEARTDYAQMLFQQDNLAEARAVSEKVLASTPDNARAQLVLGQVLFAQKDYKGAREHLEAAVVAAPSFDTGYLLGMTYIKLGDFGRARLVFDDLVTGFGDTVRMHMMFGMAYKEGGWEALDNAILELKKALAKDSQAARAHFLIALAYIDRDGESAFAQAAEELRAELKVNPQDSRAHYLLGYIAMKQHDTKTAESELLKSAELDPRNPDPFVYLGQIYSDSNRDAEAETMLRKAISLSTNGSSTDYLIGRAHYVLGRLILKAGKREEGEKELALSQQIRDRMNRPDATRDSKMKSDPELANMSQGAPAGKPTAPPAVPPQTAESMRAYLNGLKPAIADAYNNLGVIEAGRKNFKTAAEYFRRAGEWSPGLETLDRNWGMASFYAAEYQDAVAPLTRQLQKKSDDVRVRAALGLSLFTLQNFRGTLETLKPIQSDVDADPGLGYAFAVSLVKMGEYDEGVRRLKTMADAEPNSADVHMMLGSAFADQREYDTALQEYRKSIEIDPNQVQAHYLTGLALIRNGHPKDAVEEFRTALKLSPSHVLAKYHLAFSLIHAEQKDEAKTLLQEVIQQDPTYADAYYELGKLQLEQGDSKGAVVSLESGTKASPDADYIHYQLAMAYRRESRKEDAERELKLYQTLKGRQRGRGDAPQTE